MMQIAAALERAGAALPTAHTIQVLDASIRGLAASTLLMSSLEDAAPNRTAG